MNVKPHISDDQLIGYIYRTINDAQRETIDTHLSGCPVCREKLNRHQDHYTLVNQEIRLAMNAVNPPTRMVFDQVAPRLQPRNQRFNFPRMLNTLPATAALAGLALALVGLLKIVRTFSLFNPSQTASALPALACFCLIFVSMDQFDRSHSLRPGYILSVLLAGLLWLGTAVLGFLNLISVRDIALILLVDAGRSQAEASFYTILVVMLAAIGFIALVIGGAEFHYKRIGHPTSWKVFIWTLVFQLLIFITPYFLW